MYRRQRQGNYQQKHLTVLKTKKWGEVKFPRGTKPAVVEIQVNGNQPLILKEGIGYKKDADLEAIKKQLEANAKKNYDISQKAEITVNLPQTKRKPLKLTVQGGQPLQPKILHHPSWPPPDVEPLQRVPAWLLPWEVLGGADG